MIRDLLQAREHDVTRPFSVACWSVVAYWADINHLKKTARDPHSKHQYLVFGLVHGLFQFALGVASHSIKDVLPCMFSAPWHLR